MDQYEALIARVHVNRGVIRMATTENQNIRTSLTNVKKNIMDIVGKRMKKQSLSEICYQEFGKLDRRFHVLFSFFRKG